ncbi:tyrosine-type recombinase/integrase [Pseudoduganella dura]|nr:tyrosine-type recombinase/integrase [Pseudoduganella dura]
MATAKCVFPVPIVPQKISDVPCNRASSKFAAYLFAEASAFSCPGPRHRAAAPGEDMRNTYRSTIKHLREYFDKAPVDLIRPTDIAGFLDELRDIPTTANRCKRVFSTIWNHARAWGYTDLANPCEGIRCFSLEKRLVYITDNIFDLVQQYAAEPLRDAMDLAYLTGQRPGDALKLTEQNIEGAYLVIKQNKTSKPLRIEITGKLAELMERIRARKRLKPIVTAALLVHTHGKRATGPALRYQFDQARDAAIERHPELAEQVRTFWFYDLRARAADDTSDVRGDQAASDLLGHENVQTTRRHYLRRGKVVAPTK